MGWQDRDYARQPTRGGGGRHGGRAFGLGGNSVTTWLLCINIGVFILDMILAGQVGRYVLETSRGEFYMRPLYAWGHFSISFAFEQGQLWRLLTFQFLHADIMHLFGNMLAMYFFGYMVESWLGSRRYLVFYLLCGFAGIVGLLGFAAGGFFEVAGWTPMVGASAGIFGILIAATRIAPNTVVMLLFPPIPMRLRTFAWVLIGLAAFTVFPSGPNAGGEAAHLGGAALGYLLINHPGLLSFVDAGPRGRRPSLRTGARPDAQEVNRILDKVRDQGLQSLSESERRTLQRATDDQRRAG